VNPDTDITAEHNHRGLGITGRPMMKFPAFSNTPVCRFGRFPDDNSDFSVKLLDGKKLFVRKLQPTV